MIALYSNSNFRSGANITSFHHGRKRPRMYQPITFTLKRPLLTMSACSAIADQHAEQLAQRIEDGSILAFNIALRAAHSRPCVRVLATSLAEHLSAPGRRSVETPAQVLAQVSAIFPALAETIRTDTFARILGCTISHARHLAHGGAVRVIKEGKGGRGHSALFCRRSCVEFLMQRRIA